MMQRCSNMVGLCTCGLFHSHSHSNHNSFSMLFNSDVPNSHYYYNNNNNNLNNSSSVDCTLSLAPPSTRLSDRSTSFCWSPPPHKTSRSSATANNNTNNDPLLARRCSNCDTTSTPLWRNGPRGPKSLCNACGIRFKKEERRAAAAASGGGAMEQQQQQQQHVVFNSTCWNQQTQKMAAACYMPAGNEFRFGDHDVDGRDSFPSWRLNVTDRPALVHDFTR